jgi:hypothetical protein
MRSSLIGLTIAVGLFAPQAAAASLRTPSLPPPGAFAARVDNPWFPLIPGTVFVYRGVKDGRPARDVITVTPAHATVLGVRVTVVRDRLYLSGRLAERTTDWYAQDRSGNVWYLGERTATVDRRGATISTDGSWRAGVRGASAGIFMPAHPRPGETGRQEFYPGHAEDQFEVLSLRATVRSSAVSSDRALLTQETTPLEPGTVDHKLYVRGVGTVREETVRGPVERLVLVSVRHLA